MCPEILSSPGLRSVPAVDWSDLRARWPRGSATVCAAAMTPLRRARLRNRPCPASLPAAGDGPRPWSGPSRPEPGMECAPNPADLYHARRECLSIQYRNRRREWFSPRGQNAYPATPPRLHGPVDFLPPPGPEIRDRRYHPP